MFEGLSVTFRFSGQSLSVVADALIIRIAIAKVDEAAKLRHGTDNHQTRVSARRKTSHANAIRIDQWLPMGIVEQRGDGGFDLNRPTNQHRRVSHAAHIVEVVLGMFKRGDDETVARQIGRQVVVSEIRAAVAVRNHHQRFRARDRRGAEGRCDVVGANGGLARCMGRWIEHPARHRAAVDGVVDGDVVETHAGHGLG